MFNLKRKTKQVVNEIKKSFEPIQDPQTIIAEIHEAFDSSTERLLNEAIKVLANKKDLSKGERMKNLGFVKTIPASEYSRINEEKDKSEKLAHAIEYYKTYYPFNKFITLSEVESICKKYSLLFSTCDNYIGDIPDKNLKEIENFKFREEDKIEYNPKEWYRSWGGQNPGQSYNGFGYYRSDFTDKWGGRNEFVIMPEDDKTITKVLEQPKFLICASVKDFDTRNMRIEDGFKLVSIPDPIVLQPVKDGYLIVSKWGLEAEDADLINEKLN